MYDSTYPPDAPTVAQPQPQPQLMPPSGPRPALRTTGMIVGALVAVLALTLALTAAVSSARGIAYPLPKVSIIASGGGNARVGAPIQFSASATAGRDLAYTWGFSDGTVASGQSVSHTYTQFGQMTVSLAARDPIGQTASAQLTLTVLPPLPRAAFAFQQEASNPLTVDFDASSSTGEQPQYAWNFGDGNTDQGVSVSHQYAGVGTYTVTLTVTDAANQTAKLTRSVTISLPKPVASFTATATVGFPGNITFDASASTGYQITYAWVFGDGNGETDYSAQASHFYGAPGSYTVTLTITDALGRTAVSRRTIAVTFGG
ncbi:MAG: PKD domain-containing protein [Ktedonobacterales bacterium]|nr:PKD domain-containing protein [Ktedonobacterales bacterium]